MHFQGKAIFNASFDVYANNYDEIRPSYPNELFQDIFSVCNIQNTDEILEIGAGSGIATKKLEKFNCNVTAIEPGENLYKITHSYFMNKNKIQVLNTTFEDFCTNKKFNVIATFTALHWLKNNDTYTKLSNLLNLDGRLVTVWNSFLQIDNIISDEVNNLYEKWLSHIYQRKSIKEVNQGVMKKLNNRISELATNPNFNLIFLNRYLTYYHYDEKTYPQLLKTFPKIISMEDDSKREAFLNDISKTIKKYNKIICSSFVYCY